MRRALILLAAVAALVAAGAQAEVWNDPSGITVNATSQTITLPRPLSTVVVFNDSTTDSIYSRIFWCSEVPAPATSTNLEIKPGTWRAFTFESVTEPSTGYCAVSLVGPSGGAAVRLEGK